VQSNITVKNQNSKTILCRDLKIADSPADKFLGLHAKSNPRSLLFKTRFGMHTLLLKNPIDIIVCNSQFRVVTAQTVTPNHLFIYNPLYPYVLELPQGTIKKSKTQIGDKLDFSANINM
jgi:uncharacterized membrane protein (UPF0127 family)